jgi:hypothetical protein
MLDGRSFLAFPVDTTGRQLPRLTVRCGQALRLRPGAGVIPKANVRLSDGMGPDCYRRIDE